MLLLQIKRRKQEADDDKEFSEISGGGVLSGTGRSASMLNPAYNPDATVLATGADAALALQSMAWQHLGAALVALD